MHEVEHSLRHDYPVSLSMLHGLNMLHVMGFLSHACACTAVTVLTYPSGQHNTHSKEDMCSESGLSSILLCPISLADTPETSQRALSGTALHDVARPMAVTLFHRSRCILGILLNHLQGLRWPLMYPQQSPIIVTALL